MRDEDNERWWNLVTKGTPLTNNELHEGVLFWLKAFIVVGLLAAVFYVMSVLI